ncbi:hemolymph lipopolysaccharide-binding protein-like [Ischnura elegans]|uniref:hemolymph lipopolysaccharide-binding protein-like n=1 Tax=Ischnura elegans TaxID=197161 RepID=UPI001ED898CA|nr:hemolymph lipopolysaccharide-binding protein-like [Ischnura elegans]
MSSSAGPCTVLWSSVLLSYLLLHLHCEGTAAQLPCDTNQWTLPRGNMTVSFSVLTAMNRTKHWNTHFAFTGESVKLPDKLKMHVEQRVESSGGVERFHLEGLLVVLPKVPLGYNLYAGVGHYKRHEKGPGGWDKAYSTCASEGAHLAIINSEAEYDVIRSLGGKDNAYLGFHDRVKEGEWVTVFGEPLDSTGFTRWIPKQPDNAGGIEHCGSYHPRGGLNDIPCNLEFPFICEFDLSWSE